MTWSLEEVRTLLSADLARSDLDAVMEEVRAMQEGHGLLAADHEDFLLQGDVYAGVPCVQRQGEELRLAPRNVALISNSCDAAIENKRARPLELTVAPILRLTRFQQMLLDNGVTQQGVDDITKSIKSQSKTDLVYLPAAAGLTEDMVILLDKTQSLPSEEFLQSNPKRLAVLTQRGFWLFLLKLSMHFLRPHEGVARA